MKALLGCEPNLADIDTVVAVVSNTLDGLVIECQAERVLLVDWGDPEVRYVRSVCSPGVPNTREAMGPHPAPPSVAMVPKKGRALSARRAVTHRWTLELDGKAYRLFDKQSDGKGVFLM